MFPLLFMKKYSYQCNDYELFSPVQLMDRPVEFPHLWPALLNHAAAL